MPPRSLVNRLWIRRAVGAAAVLAALLITGCADYVLITGSIDTAAADRVERELAGATASTVVLDLESGGGNVLAGIRIISAIEQIRLRAKVVTRVRSRCHSMCVALFLAGDERMTNPDALFLMHGVRDADGSHRPDLTGQMVTYYVNRGLDPRWVDKQIVEGPLAGRGDVVIAGADLTRRLAEPQRSGPSAGLLFVVGALGDVFGKAAR